MKNLPFHIRETLRVGLGPCFMAFEVDDVCAVIAKLPDGCLRHFRRKFAITFQSQLGTFSSGAVLRLVIGLCDRPENPFEIEVFLGGPDTPQWVIDSGFKGHDPRTEPNTMRLAVQLTRQSNIPVHFAEFDGSYAGFSQKLTLSGEQQRELASLVAQANAHNATVERLDFGIARAAMEQTRQRRRPSEAWLSDGYRQDYLLPWECRA